MAETHLYEQQISGYQRERGWGEVDGVKRVKCLVMEENLTSGGKYTMQ